MPDFPQTAWTKKDAKDWSKLDYIAQWVAAAASEVHISVCLSHSPLSGSLIIILYHQYLILLDWRNVHLPQDE